MRQTWILIAGLGVGATDCAQLFGLDDAYLVEDDGRGGTSTGTGGMQSSRAASGGGGTVTSSGSGCAEICGGECADTSTDPKNCGGCGHDCLGGACQMGLCQPILLASGEASPWGIAIDATSVYWSTDDLGTVKKVPIGGGSTTTLATAQGNVIGIAVDATSVYWVSNAGNKVLRSALDGGSLTTIASGQTLPFGVAVNATNVFWTTMPAMGGTVMRAPLGGGSPTAIATAQTDARDISVDAKNVYWTAGDAIMKAPIGGAPTTVATGQRCPRSVTVDHDNIYWTNNCSPGGPGSVMKVPIEGGNATPLAPPDPKEAYGLAVDEAYVYWTVAQAGTIQRVPIGGGQPLVLASSQNRPRCLAVNAKAIYWTDSGTGMADGAIMKLAK